MSNFKINASLIDDHEFDFFTKIDSCDLLVKQIMTTTTKPPTKDINIEVNTKSGRKVNIHIPNDENGVISIFIDDNEI